MLIVFKEYLAYRIYRQRTQFVHVDTGLVIVSACIMIATLPKVRVRSMRGPFETVFLGRPKFLLCRTVLFMRPQLSRMLLHILSLVIS